MFLVTITVGPSHNLLHTIALARNSIHCIKFQCNVLALKVLKGIGGVVKLPCVKLCLPLK